MGAMETTQKIKTGESQENVLDALRKSFKSVSESVTSDNQNTLKIENAGEAFGMSLRKDVTEAVVTKKEDGYLVTATTSYSPSIVYWIMMVVGGLFVFAGGAGGLILIPSWILYFSNKKKVAKAIDSALEKVNNYL
jgi:hypothetical protein